MLSHYNESKSRQKTSHGRIRHGRFTSPHLIDRWDCISIDGNAIEKNVFTAAEKNVLERNETTKIGASEFELLTATAFEIFTKLQVDIAVIEVGMGGALDATNVIGQRSEYDENQGDLVERDSFRPLPLATGITSIGLDHQNFLGDTIQKIAAQKAGILKPGVPAVVAADDDAALKMISEQAGKVRVSQLIPVTAETTPEDLWQCNYPRPPQNISHEVLTALRRPIQKRWPNGAIATQLAWKALSDLGRLEEVSEATRLELFLELAQIPEMAQWPGRLQRLSIESLTGLKESVILDGAHNAESATILSSFVREQTLDKPVVWVLAASKGKDIRKMLNILLRPGDVVHTVEFGEVEGMPWVQAMSSSEIAAEAQKIIGGLFNDRRSQALLTATSGSPQPHGRSILAALKEASRTAETQAATCVIAGSLYLVGDVMRLSRDGTT